MGSMHGKHALDTISFPGSRGSFRSETRMAASEPLRRLEASREPLRCQSLSLQSMLVSPMNIGTRPFFRPSVQLEKNGLLIYQFL